MPIPPDAQMRGTLSVQATAIAPNINPNSNMNPLVLQTFENKGVYSLRGVMFELSLMAVTSPAVC